MRGRSGRFIQWFIVLCILATAACAREPDVAIAGGALRGALANDPWPSYNRTLDGQRFSPLNQVTTSNAAQLAPVCEFGMGEEGGFQTGPVVVGDTMFLTTAHTTVAINAANCALIWRAIDTARTDDPFPINRGVAYLDGRVYRGQPGGRIVALSSRTGEQLWETKAANGGVGEFLSSAPVAWEGMVFIGLAGGDWGIRGAMMGFDAATGEQKWKFYTIPIGNERGADTWKIPETAHRGGGGTWTSYTLDPATGEIFVPVGNPAPDLNPAVRPGDNLFSNSVVVLDARTGELKWWYQTVANDGYDWDLSAAPALYTTADGSNRVAIAGKEGLLASVDRVSHDARFRIPITTILNADKDPTPTGIRACPGVLGGVQWNGPALDPRSQTLYVGTVDWCATFMSGEQEYIAGQLYMGTGFKPDPTEEATGWVHAINGNDGAIRWKKKMTHPMIAGVTPTAGGVVFTGDIDGNFYALDAANGNELYTFRSDGSLAGGVVTYSVRGRQYVAFTSGNVSRGTFDTKGSPKVVILALEAGAQAFYSVTLPEVNGKGLVASQPPVVRGEMIFANFCSACHGARGEQGVANSRKRTVDALAAFVRNPTGAMPRLYPAPLDDAEVVAVATYVRDVLQQNPQRPSPSQRTGPP